MDNQRRLPVFMTATCELFRYDDPDTYSAGEAILFNPQGGVALLTRTVYSSGSAVNRAFETALDDAQGRCLGDIYRDTKNQTNHLPQQPQLQLMGDPALELAYPSERVYLTQVPTPCVRLMKWSFVGTSETRKATHSWASMGWWCPR